MSYHDNYMQQLEETVEKFYLVGKDAIQCWRVWLPEKDEYMGGIDWVIYSHSLAKGYARANGGIVHGFVNVHVYTEEDRA